jgi:DinB family protein
MVASTAVITPPQAGRLLDAALIALRAELSALSEEVLAWHPAPGEWCAKEVLGHLIEAERRGFSGRIRIILETQDPTLEAWDQVAVARERQDCRRDVALLLEEFTRMRDAGAALAARLTTADLARGGHHPKVGFLRVGDIVQEWIHHDRNHFRQIMANVQAFVWPAMGATQLFSAP